MEGSVLRDKLHKYIDLAEESKIEAIYTILEEEISSYTYSTTDIEKFHARRNRHLKGETPSYSPIDSINMTRSEKK